MNEQEKEALQYRFQGYQLPKVQLVAGFDSYYVGVHPYYFNQPVYWTKPLSIGTSLSRIHIIEGECPITESGYVNEAPVSNSNTSETQSGGTSQSRGTVKMMQF